jgi:peptidoglycan/LPS O-acetylase OafA/YrhL
MNPTESSHRVPSKNFRADIQILRGIAVLGVLLFHINSYRFPDGYLGVDAFFVISGFVVMPLIMRVFINADKVSNDVKENLKGFYKRRIFRLAPALAATLVVSVPLVLLFGNVTDHDRFIKQGIATILLLGNVGAFFYSGSTYFAPNPNPLVHTWSLSTEEQIYLLIPLLIWATLKVRKVSPTFIPKFIIAMTIGSFSLDMLLSREPSLLHLVHIQNSSSFIFYTPISRLWEFGIGAILYFTTQKFNKIRLSIAVEITAPLILLASILSPIHTVLSSGLITCLATALAIYCQVLNRTPHSLSRIPVWLGDRSYSIYLVHMPLVYLIFDSGLFGIASNLGKSALAAVAAVSVGAFQYSLVENRFRHQWKAVSTTKLLSGALLIPLLVLALGFGLYKSSYLGIYKSAAGNTGQADTHIALQKGCVDKEFNPTGCTWNTSGRKGTIAVFGDSQAYSLADGVVSAGSKLGYKVLVSSISGCPYLSYDTTGGKPLNCAIWQTQTRNWIHNNKPSWLVIANWSAGYTNPGDWRTVIDNRGHAASSVSQAMNLWRMGLRNVIQEAHVGGTKVIIVSNIPYVTKLNNRLNLFDVLTGKAMPMGFSREEALIKRRNVFSFEKTLNNPGSGIYVLDPVLTLCPETECKFIINHEAVYLDSFHLTRAGSLLLTKQYLEILR